MQKNPLVTASGMKTVPIVTATSISKLIKHQLIQDMLLNPLNHFPPYSESDETGEVGRAYAAQITSVINYGFNVANRAELRDETTSELDTISWGESAVDMDLSHSGRYIRSETGHPAREYYQDILSLLTLPDDFKERKESTNGELLQELWEANFSTNEVTKPESDKFKKELNTLYLKDQPWSFLDTPLAKELKTKLKKFDNLKAYLKAVDNFNKDINEYKHFTIDPAKHSTRLQRIQTCIEDITVILDELDKIEVESTISVLCGVGYCSKLLAHLSCLNSLLSLDIAKMLSNKADGDKAYWLGQWKSPQEIMENLFSELSFNDVNFLSQHLLKQSLKRLNSNDKNGELRTVSIPSTPISSEYTFSDAGRYRDVMQCRVAITRTLATVLKPIEIECSKGLIQSEAPASDYPCVIFDLRPLIKHLQSKAENKDLYDWLNFKDSDMCSSAIGVLNNVLLSYFSGLINQKSKQAYGKDYIELQPQGSFGSIRPSITDTGYSFRLSPGLIPASYATILSDAYEALLTQLRTEKSQASLMRLLALEVEVAKEFEKTKKKRETVGTNMVSENGVRIKISDLAKSGVTLIAICEHLINDPKITPEQFVSLDANTLPKSETQVSTTKHDATAPVELSAILNNLVYVYLEHQKKFAPDPTGFVKSLDKVINWVIDTQKKSIDYSTVATKVESLCRLLQLRYEIAIEKKRIDRNAKEEKTSLKRSASVDSILTVQEDYKTTASRSGMAGFTQAINIVNDAYKVSYRGDMAEIYFEIDADTPKEIYQYHFKDEAKHHGDWQLQEGETGTAQIKLVDIAAFPRHKVGTSTKTVWKEDWTKIDELKKPEILMVDMTSGTLNDLEHLYEEFKKSANGLPYAMLIFASDNKYGQGGVDITSMGELRLVTKPTENLESNSEAQTLVDNLKTSFTKTCADLQENNTSAKAYRKVLQNAGLRRSSKGWLAQ